MSGSQDSHDRPLGRLAEVMAQYLLSAIGAAPHLSRPNFPQPASHYALLRPPSWGRCWLRLQS